MRQIKVGQIVQDFTIYPRVSVDPQHITYLKEAISAEVVIPPLIICADSFRLVDGFHRCQAYLSLYGADHLVDVIEKTYKNEAEILLDAIRYNATHGRMLSRYDRIHCLLLAEKLELTIDQAANALQMTVNTLTSLRTTRVANTQGARRSLTPTPIKRSIQHMAGQTLSAKQIDAHKKLSGMNQLFHVNQIVILIESKLLDEENSDLMDRLEYLGKLIRQLKRSAA